MNMEILDTMTCEEFSRRLRDGEWDDGDTAVIVSTSSESMAESIEDVAYAHGIARNLLTLVYHDVEFSLELTEPTGEGAFNPGHARAAWSFLSNCPCERLLPVCDGSVSRSAAIRAAAARLLDGDDLHCWIDLRYRPNVLVYYRMLQAAGVALGRTQIARRLRLNRMLLDCKVFGRPVYGMHLVDGAFRAIEAGEKDVELRQLDEKRALLRPGDALVFQHCDTGEVLLASVRSLHAYGSFEQLFEEWPDAVRRAGFTDAAEAVSAMTGVYCESSMLALAICVDVMD